MECAAIDELALLLDGRRGEELQRRAEAHVAGCLHCQTELALLREFESPAIRPEEQRDVNWIVARLRKNPTVAPVPWWKQIWTARFLAPASIALATAIIAIAIGLNMRQSPLSPVPGPGREVMRSQAVELMSPTGDIKSAPAELRWRPVAGASSYRVRLLEVDRTELWSTTVSQSSVALPGAVREKIVPLKTLMWEITALDDAGALVASSGLQAFRLKASASH